MYLSTVTCGFLLLFSTLKAFSQKPVTIPDHTQLELIDIKQLGREHTQRFDLSGIVSDNGAIHVVADKHWNTYIYRISLSEKEWNIDHKFALDIHSDTTDFEGIDFCKDLFYLIDERKNIAYTVNHKGQSQAIPLQLESYGETPTTWLKNTGWEGVAVDCDHETIYLAKERQPRFIIKASLRTGEVLEKFSTPESESNDYSDMKFEEGYLYLLERNGNFITKVDPNSHKVVEKLSFRHTNSHPKGKLFEPSKYGMAEALLLTEKEIWIGLDNNGLEVSKYARKRHKLRGHYPILMRFHRPIGF